VSREIDQPGWGYHWEDGTLFVTREKDDPEGWLASPLKVDVGVFLSVLDRDLARVREICSVARADLHYFPEESDPDVALFRIMDYVKTIRAQASTLLAEHFNPCPNNKRRRSENGTDED
jgi:hypothetical protein